MSMKSTYGETRSSITIHGKTSRRHEVLKNIVFKKSFVQSELFLQKVKSLDKQKWQFQGLKNGF